jgi:putative toxin-antitoxin system antitoxin component (TIGR02293 family)
MSKLMIMTKTELKIKDKLDKEIVSFFKHSHIDKKDSTSIENLTYSDFLSNRMLIIYIIRQGVPYSLFNLIQHYTPFTDNDWAKILDISTKSLQRYKQTSKQFKSIQSEKIIEMAEVTNIGLDVFGNMDKLKLWLDTPNYSLGNLKPFELLKDSYGKEMVISELTRINYGILA